MVSGRARLVLGGSLLALAACGGQTASHGAPAGTGAAGAMQAGRAGSGADGGTAGATGGTAGESTSGGTGTEGGAPAAGSGGEGNATAIAGGAGSGGGGADPMVSLPNENEREQEILAPLATDDATIDTADGSELVELADAVGVARGYAMCRCARSPTMPPEDIDAELECARAETGLFFLMTPDQARCIEDGMAGVPGFAEHLRCLVKYIRNDGVNWAKTCMDPGTAAPPLPFSCTPSPEVEALAEECRSSVYCADDTRIRGFRCDSTFDCTDQSDELGCFEERGHDWFWCDGELEYPPYVCVGDCGLAKVPPVCDGTRMDVYLCNDGAEVNVTVVCDRALDCPDGSDERYCVK
jgi:hypothetical protein